MQAGAQANSGTISIDADSLTITNGSTIGTLVRTGGRGNSGDINITVREDIKIDGSELPPINIVTGIDTGLADGAIGQGGEINIQARNLFLNDAGVRRN